MDIHKKITAFLLAWWVGFASCAAAEDLPVIRMVVADKVRDFTVGIAGPFSVQGDQREILLQGNSLIRSRVTAAQGGIRVGENQIASGRVLLQANVGDIQIGEKFFGPRLEIISSGSDRLTLVSLMDLEEYTSGVMAKEMEPTWPLEVLKAQAVLARTNAVYAYLKNKGKAFHVTRYSPQVYERTPQEHLNAAAAVEETRGLVLMYDDCVIPAYFHSVCGGSTESAINVWQQSCSYPRAVLCGYCKNAPRFRWTSRMSLEDFQSKLAVGGLSVGDVMDVFASKVSDVSDRVTEIVIEHSAGKTILRTNTLRTLLGHNNIRSTNFTVEQRDGELIFKGQGWGHGVGLCQWGAKVMAQSGKDFEEILKFYYPGVRIARVKE